MPIARILYADRIGKCDIDVKQFGSPKGDNGRIYVRTPSLAAVRVHSILFNIFPGTISWYTMAEKLLNRDYHGRSQHRN